jgi:hypothetical protein
MDLISLIIVISVIIAHFFADFVCQAEVWALGKRKSFKLLLQHTATYTVVLTTLLLGVLWIEPLYILYFFIFNFFAHTLVDYFTSKLVGKRFDDKHLGSPIPNLGAFSMIGLDQVIHYICIFGSLYFLT